jgi:glycosyltransferase involved in cell wall biosynthesis
MRILYVMTSMGMGGAERQALALADRMAARGHTVALMILRPVLDEEWPTSLEVIHLNMRKNSLSVLRGLLRGRRVLVDFRPDLVHSHSFHANIVGRMLKVMRPRTVVVSTVHNVYEGGWLRMIAYRLSDGLCRKTTAVSRAAADRFARLKAVSRAKCLVVPNAIDVSEFAPNAARRVETRLGMGVGDEFVWLAGGRVVPAKDYPNLLRAFEVVKAAYPRAQLWIAGELFGEPPVSGADKASNSVRWLGLRRDMAALYDAADGFVLSSAWEGMPLAVAEAMAMETVVVATDVGGVRELVGDAGEVVPAQDSDALAGAMVGVMDWSMEDRTALGGAARERIRTRFSMEARADEWERLYCSLLRSGAGK